jgi:polyisoprenyl-teichoic acid--peptidoglycan teichoic acid transferase
MEEAHIKKIEPGQKKRKTPIKRIVVFLGILFLGVLLLSLIYMWFHSSTSTSSPFRFTLPVVQSPIKSTDDRVNVLLLGNPGGRHDGTFLTDSIVVASYNLKTNKVTLISIPRDLWLQDEQAKVNTIYQTGMKDGNGISYAKEKIGNIVGLPIHYGVRLDFSGFSKAIDQVGGIDVDVPVTFDDYNYPIEGKEKDLCGNIEKEVDLNEEQAKALNLPVGKHKMLFTPSDKPATESADFACRFDHIHYDKGLTHMNGPIALTFVRSRQGTNGEGSDFARSRRQQLVIQAFREKVLSLDTLANPQKLIALATTFGDSFETDIPLDKSLDFLALVKKNSGTESVVLGDLGRGQSILIHPPAGQYGGAYVLIPPNDDFSTIQEFVKKVLEVGFDEATKSAHLK